jgi:thioesterase domain-containing protein
MSEKSEFSETKRALLEKYLRGELHNKVTVPTGRSPQESAIHQPTAAASRVPLAAIQPAGTKQPFFYFHPHWQGGAFYCFALARDLGADQPFYILDPYRFDGLKYFPTMAELVADYVKTLRSVQPHGPYLLGGFCGAGLIAYETACQLLAAGEAVDLLVLIDPMAGAIGSIRWIGSSLRRIGRLLHFEPGEQLDWFLRLRYLSRTLRHAQDEYTQHVDKIIQRWRNEHPQRFWLIPAAEALRQDWFGPFIWLVSGYLPSHYPGKVTYFFARENAAGRKLWWGDVTENAKVEIHTIPGTHETCRTIHLQELAKELRTCISKVQATAPR